MNIEDIYTHQMRVLVERVRRLPAAAGPGDAAYEAVRQQVAGEYASKGRLEVTAAAIHELEGGPGCQRLQHIADHCGESFCLEDRMLSALVVPVFVRLTSPADDDVVLSAGDQKWLTSLASLLKSLTGSSKVLFDRNLYERSALYRPNPKKLLSYLLQLESGAESPVEGPKTSQVKSQAEPPWVMRYFLGVEIADLYRPQWMDDESLQRKLMPYRYFGASALSQCTEVLRNPQVRAEAECKGAWYLNRGVRLGENLRRGYGLQQQLANFDIGDKGVEFHHAYDLMGSCVRLLVSSHVMTMEHRWKLFGGELPTDFRQELDDAIALMVPADEVRHVREVDLFDYEAIAKTKGLSYLFRAAP